ncbi:MAG: hypothetical protein R3D45_12980 [Rhizobiaceae bacterium]
MNRIAQAAAALLVAAFSWQPADACEEYRSLSTAEMKEFRDKLVETDADPLDRMFAFEELNCSDNPTIRAYAVREGLKNATDPLVRHQIMFEALMQKTRIDVELSKAGKLKGGDKRFYDKNDGVYSREVSFRDRASGCIGISFNRCASNASLIISGDTVEYTHGAMIGVFKLTEQNELVGFLRPDNRSEYSKIPAIIRLF